MFGEDEELPKVSHFTETDLFSKPKVFVLNKMLEMGESMEKIIASANAVVIMVKSLDKRKKETKDLLARKDIITKEFILPHGKELDKWIINRVGEYGGKISADAANELVIRLGRDEARETKFGGKIVSVEEIYNLWQAESEVNKLIAYADGREISRGDVIGLVAENGETDALAITNAIADKNQQQAFNLINQFLKEQTASDEKGSIIQLNALLAEQFRNVAMVQDFLSQKTSENDILDKTGWKSGRLFIMKKIAGRFIPAKILDLLNKLAALDEELKTSQTPPRVLLDLILSQIF